jgi:hypothetical protein
MIPAPTRTEERVHGTGAFDANGEVTIRLPRRRPGQPAIVSRLIGATVEPDNPTVQDSFHRNVAEDGWGAPGDRPTDRGPPYIKTLDDGADQKYGVNGQSGTMLNNTAVARNWQIYEPIDAFNFDAYIAEPAAGAVSANVRWIGITGRVFRTNFAAGEGYLLAYDGAKLSLNAANAFGFDDLPQGFGFMDTIGIVPAAFGGIGIRLRFQCEGDTLRGKVWSATSTTEPVAWTIEATSLIYGQPGGVGVYWHANALILANSWDDFIVNVFQAPPIWDAYISDPDQLLNLIDSSVVPTSRWIPQIVNGQRLNPGEELVVIAREGTLGDQAVVTCSFVYST